MTTMGNFDLSMKTLNFIVNRKINVCIRTTYYIFCMRNKEWKNPKLLKLVKTDTNVSSTVTVDETL